MRTGTFASTLALIFLGAVAVPAQSLWLEPTETDEISLEILHPALENVDYLTFLSQTYFLSLRREIGDGIGLSLELPFAHYAEEVGVESDNAPGNVYVGGRFGARGNGARFDLGLRLPTAPSDNMATVLGYYADPVDRMEAFAPEVLSIVAGAGWRNRSDDGNTILLRLAPALWLDTGDTLRDSQELFLLYSFRLVHDGEKGAIGIGVSGRLLATEDDLDFGERTNHQLGLFANRIFGSWRPGVQLRVPLDTGLSDVLNPILSLSVGRLLD